MDIVLNVILKNGVKIMKNNVFLINCMDFMKDKPDNYYDLAIVDVNYGIKQDGRNNHTRGKLAISKDYRKNSRYDDKPPEKIYFNELIKISKNQIIFGANHFISRIPYDSSCWIVWDKMNGKTDFADCELAYTSFKTAVRIFKFMWQGMLQGYSGNKNKNEKRIHPNQKPVILYKWLLTNYAKPGQKIFDSHVGSGSIRIACHDMGFDFEGCEIDADYWQAQEERYKNHVAQGELFEKKEYQDLIYNV